MAMYHSCAQHVLHVSARMEYASQHPVYATLPMTVETGAMKLDVVSDQSAFYNSS